jgi:hypothetical protein
MGGRAKGGKLTWEAGPREGVICVMGFESGYNDWFKE